MSKKGSKGNKGKIKPIKRVKGYKRRTPVKTQTFWVNPEIVVGIFIVIGIGVILEILISRLALMLEIDELLFWMLIVGFGIFVSVTYFGTHYKVKRKK